MMRSDASTVATTDGVKLAVYMNWRLWCIR
jgi:hypothetical protein